MPKLSTRLLSTERACQLARPISRRTEYRVAGVRGLVLLVNDRGTKSWACLYKSPVTSSWRKVGLGSYPTVGLQQAKELALDCLAGVRVGRDPLAVDPMATMTFRRISDDYREAHKDRHSAAWTRAVKDALERDILPHLNGHRAEAVKRHDIARIMERVVARDAPASANQALKVTRAIYRWGVSTGRCETDPTFSLKPIPSKPRDRVLTASEIRHVWNVPTHFQLAFRLQLLTATRIGEVLKASKDEFDLEQRVWVIPAGRTKSRRAHVLPLSPQALDVVRDAMEKSGCSRWLFPSRRSNRPLCCRSAATMLSRLNTVAGITERFTPHDLRRSAATGMGDLGVSDEVIERILNHAPPTTSRRHYNHSLRVDEMRGALETWGAHVSRLVGAL